MELVVFRIVQESLTNVHRHSGSKAASIRLSRDADRIVIKVRDEGKGMSPEKLAQIQSQGSGVGISGMRERLRHFDGELSVESDTNGTEIVAILPSSHSGQEKQGLPGRSSDAA